MVKDEACCQGPVEIIMWCIFQPLPLPFSNYAYVYLVANTGVKGCEYTNNSRTQMVQ